MKTTPILLLGCGSLALAIAAAQQPATPKIQNVPIQHTAVTSGTEMYSTYCAVCHGADGKGNGPAASSLKTHPADLTQLSKKNGEIVGTFSVQADDEVMLVTNGGQIIRMSVNDVRFVGRQTQGVTLFRIEDSEQVVSAAIIRDDGGEEEA